MRENDICTWRYKDEQNGHIGDPYHCKARKGIVHNGQLLDLFWMNIGSHFAQAGWSQSRSGGKSVPLDKITFEVVANIDDLTEIPRGQERYYRREDVVDLQNPNSSSAPIYIKNGAERDRLVMAEYAGEKIETARRELKYAQRDLEEWTAKAAEIAAGDLNQIYL